MTEIQMKKYVLAIVSALYDLDPEGDKGPVPASAIYLAMKTNLDDYNQVAMVLAHANLARVSAETISLTTDGRKLGKRIAEALANPTTPQG